MTNLFSVVKWSCRKRIFFGRKVRLFRLCLYVLLAMGGAPKLACTCISIIESSKVGRCLVSKGQEKWGKGISLKPAEVKRSCGEVLSVKRE